MEGVSGVTFGQEYFGSANLGDKRRTARLVRLPDKVNDPTDRKALYRLMDCEEATHRSVLESPRQRTPKGVWRATSFRRCWSPCSAFGVTGNNESI